MIGNKDGYRKTCLFGAIAIGLTDPSKWAHRPPALPKNWNLSMLIGWEGDEEKSECYGYFENTMDSPFWFDNSVNFLDNLSIAFNPAGLLECRYYDPEYDFGGWLTMTDEQIGELYSAQCSEWENLPESKRINFNDYCAEVLESVDDFKAMQIQFGIRQPDNRILTKRFDLLTVMMRHKDKTLTVDLAEQIASEMVEFLE